MERRFSQEALNGLRRRGHDLHMLGDWEAAGNEMMTLVDPETGALQGAADPRRDGYAVGW